MGREIAKHRIDTCPTCKGVGTIQGPKVVQLVEEERGTWRALKAEEKKLSAYFIGGQVSAVLILIAYVVIAVANSVFTVARSVFIMGLVVSVLLAIALLMVVGYRLSNRNREIQNEKQELLARYGIGYGEKYEVREK